MGKQARTDTGGSLYYASLPFARHNTVPPQTRGGADGPFALFAAPVAPSATHLEPFDNAPVAELSGADLPAFTAPTPVTQHRPAQVIRPMAQPRVGHLAELGVTRP